MGNTIGKPVCRSLSVCICVALLMLPTSAAGQQRLSPTESAQALEALTTWFECEECEAGELAAVTKYGQAVVPSLAAVLRGGLSPAAREHLRGELELRYDALVERSKKNPNARPKSSKSRFVSRYLDNRDAQYRVRAAQALAAIGGRDARRVLEEASQQRHRGDVQAVIRISLQKVK
jgi:hypothetical protein